MKEKFLELTRASSILALAVAAMASTPALATVSFDTVDGAGAYTYGDTTSSYNGSASNEGYWSSYNSSTTVTDLTASGGLDAYSFATSASAPKFSDVGSAKAASGGGESDANIILTGATGSHFAGTLSYYGDTSVTTGSMTGSQASASGNDGGYEYLYFNNTAPTKITLSYSSTGSAQSAYDDIYLYSYNAGNYLVSQSQQIGSSFTQTYNIGTGLFWIELYQYDYNHDYVSINGPGQSAAANSAGSLSFAISTPETSTWAMMFLGFAALGFAGYRSRRRVEIAA